jgi:hypothetical protein
MTKISKPAAEPGSMFGSTSVLTSNAIVRPSGDHAGYSPPTVVVTRVGLDPSAFINQMWGRSPPRVDAKEILEPSGDQAGEWSWPGLRVKFRFPEPSAFMT